MRVAHITPGTGGTIYCQNCLRDSEVLKAMQAMGHDVIKIPIYLPLTLDRAEYLDIPVFYGAINVYLKEKLPLYRYAPGWMGRMLDSRYLLGITAKKAGSTNTTGLEGLTVSMLMGEDGRQAAELDVLIAYLKKEVQPDIVHLSNGLLLGLARRLKSELGCRIVCSLQDENEWIDPMEPRYRHDIWQLMGEKAVDVDGFIASSQCYAALCSEKLHIPAENIRVIYGGIDITGYERSLLPMDPPVIGYLCRMSEFFGLGRLTDAFLQLKTDKRFSKLKLAMTGGYTTGDKRFLKALFRKIKKAGAADDVTVVKDFNRESRIQFLKSLTLLSVPVPTGESFGAYQFEALAAGVPVVQPNVGCYPEFVKATGGGVIYEPNNVESLVETLADLLSDGERLRALGEKGHERLAAGFSLDKMATEIVDVYRKVL